MSKVIIAVTDIKYNDLRIKAGDAIPIDQFDADMLVKLYELGSIDKVEVTDTVEETGLTSEDLKDAGTNMAAPVEPPVETPTETPAETPTEVPAEDPAPAATAKATTAPKTTAKPSGGAK